MTIRIDVVVLTMNDRHRELDQALTTLLAQRGVELNVVVVGNGCTLKELPDGVATIDLPDNLGAPEGRNIGARALSGGEYLFFYDDDAAMPAPDTLLRLAGELESRPEAAYVQPRIVAFDGHTTLRRWVPRLRTKHAGRPGVVTTMSEGVVLIRRADFEAVGGWAGHFFFFHEGLDLTWRLWNLGKTGWYAADIVINHPATEPTRHEVFHRFNSRNRVWAAYRNLPWPLLLPYLAAWTSITLLRYRRSPAALQASYEGFREGLTTRGQQDRRPINWRTVARLTAAGRPPII